MSKSLVLLSFSCLFFFIQSQAQPKLRGSLKGLGNRFIRQTGPFRSHHLPHTRGRYHQCRIRHHRQTRGLFLQEPRTRQISAAGNLRRLPPYQKDHYDQCDDKGHRPDRSLYAKGFRHAPGSSRPKPTHADQEGYDRIQRRQLCDQTQCSGRGPAKETTRCTGGCQRQHHRPGRESDAGIGQWQTLLWRRPQAGHPYSATGHRGKIRDLR